MVAGLTNYDLKILCSFCYIATAALHVARPGKRCFRTRVTRAQVLIRITDPTIFPDYLLRLGGKICAGLVRSHLKCFGSYAGVTFWGERSFSLLTVQQCGHMQTHPNR